MDEGGNIHFRVDFDGRWYGPDGKEVDDASIYFLSQNLRRDKDGFFIGLGFGPAKLIVEDVPLIVKGLELKGTDNRYIEMTLIDDMIERLDPATLYRRGDYFYCMVRGASIPARFDGDAAKELEKYLEVKGADIYLTI